MENTDIIANPTKVVKFPTLLLDTRNMPTKNGANEMNKSVKNWLDRDRILVLTPIGR